MFRAGLHRSRLILHIAVIALVLAPATGYAVTWTPLGPGVAVRTLAIDPSAPTTLYAGAEGSGVFKSTNGGMNWVQVGAGQMNPNIYALAIDPSTPTTLYAGTWGSGIFKSTNGGANWVPVNAGLTAPQVYSLALDPTTPTTVYAGTYGGGVFKSTNGGASWTAVNTELGNPNIYALAIDPTTPATVYAGTYGSGVYVTRTYVLTVTKDGAGSGTVTSAPAGVACGSTCTAPYDADTAVTLTATPAAGSVFSGWSGACAGTGTCQVNMTAAQSVGATFALSAPATYLLTVTKAGAGAGTVTATPGAINCGSTCTATYDIDTVVTLTATPDRRSTFTGWSGACTGTGSCIVSMTAARSVTATFVTQTYGLTVTKDGTGAGTVTSTPPGVACGSTCAAPYDIDTAVTLTATPDTRSTFTGWSGACTGTGSCIVTLDAAQSVTATFALRAASIGLYRNGSWYLDRNENGRWDGCDTDGCATWGGVPGDVPVVGDWDGTGITQVGLYREGHWYLDGNGDGIWDEAGGDRHVWWGGLPGDVPVVGDWNNTGTTQVGIYRNGTWYLDRNGNGSFDGCPTECVVWGGVPGDVPVVGDWTGTGATQVGIYRNGTWYLDTNGNGTWDAATDGYIVWGGVQGDLPVVGQW